MRLSVCCIRDCLNAAEKEKLITRTQRQLRRETAVFTVMNRRFVMPKKKSSYEPDEDYDGPHDDR